MLDYNEIKSAIGQLNPFRGDFPFYFFRPVYIPEGFTNFKNSFPELETGLDNVLHIEKAETEGSDLILLKLTEYFALSTGTLEKKSNKYLTGLMALLRVYNAVPVSIPRTLMFSAATVPFEDFMIKEYRAGAEKIQSYFKDHFSPNEEERDIDIRLEQDKKLGLLPYRSTFAQPQKGFKSKPVEVFENGLFLTAYPEENFEFIRPFLNKIIKGTEKRFRETSKVQIKRLEWSHQNLRTADLSVKVDKEFYPIHFKNFTNKAEKLSNPKFQRIARSSAFDEEIGTYHSLFLSNSPDDYDVEAHYLVGIRENSIQISPVFSKFDLWFLSQLIQTLDGYFVIEDVNAQ